MRGRSSVRRARLRLVYPTETITRDGSLATIESVATGDDARYFHGAIWPLNQKAIATAWSRDGAHAAGATGLDIDIAHDDLKPLLRALAARA